MGLTINRYNYSYRALQILRELALKIEKSKYTLEEVYDGAPTKFKEFIMHSDAEGGYVSFSFFWDPAAN